MKKHAVFGGVTMIENYLVF